MKKNGIQKLIFLVTLVIGLILPYCCGSMQVFADSDHYIKVGLKYGSNAVNRCVMTTDDGFVVGRVTSSGYSEDEAFHDYNRIIATVEDGSVVLRDKDGELLYSDLGDKGCIMPRDYDGIVTIDGKDYRGGVMLLLKGNKMSVINYVPLEQYLYGVVAAEIGQSSPAEALKAQAVAARSYVAANSGNHKSDGFDVCATTHCQVYNGVSGEYPSTTKAVDATEGEVIYSDGEPVTAFYFKNSGGYTQNSEDVWSSKESYLRSVKDTYAPDYRWTASFTFSELQKKLEQAGFNPGTIQSVAIVDRADSGAVTQLDIVGSNRTVSLKKDAIRTTLGGSSVKSITFDLVDSINSSDLSDGFYVSNGNTKQQASSDISVTNNGGGTVQLQASDLYISNGLQTIKSDSTATGRKVEKVTKSPVNLSGHGYGHGVGMAQDGAIAMAKEGFTYREILEFYYTDINIRNY